MVNMNEFDKIVKRIKENPNFRKLMKDNIEYHYCYGCNSVFKVKEIIEIDGKKTELCENCNSTKFYLIQSLMYRYKSDKKFDNFGIKDFVYRSAGQIYSEKNSGNKHILTFNTVMKLFFISIICLFPFGIFFIFCYCIGKRKSG